MMMNLADLVIPPPSPKLLDYPATLGIGIGIAFTTVLLYVAGKFDPTGGTLTISVMVVVAFMGVATFCMYFTVPSNEITSSIIGGLTAAFGAVVSFWLNHPRRGWPGERGDDDDEHPKE